MSVKDRLLQMMANEGAGIVSGEKAASRLGVSRAAVWKAIQKLQDEGYAISGTRSKGYVLEGVYDPLTECGVNEALDDDVRSAVPPVRVKGKTGSTNDDLRALAVDGAAAYSAVVAGEQTAGRGRRGRSFYSLGDTGIYLSLLLRPRAPIGQSGFITGAAAVAVCRALERVAGLEPGIKWVNDIYVGPRKLCGILTEAVADLENGQIAYAIVGIGVNVYVPNGGFPEEVAARAGTVFDEKKPNARNELAAAIISECVAAYETPDPGAFIAEYRRRSFLEGRSVDVVSPTGQTKRAGVLAINDDMSLRVRYDDGSEEDMQSGEVSIVL